MFKLVKAYKEGMKEFVCERCKHLVRLPKGNTKIRCIYCGTTCELNNCDYCGSVCELGVKEGSLD